MKTDLKAQISFKKLSPIEIIPDYLPTIKEQVKINNTRVTFSEVYVAQLKDEIAGAFILQSSGLLVLLSAIEVSKKYRKKGLGEIILTEACKKAKEQGYDEMEVTISNADIEQLSFFQKKGFEIKAFKKNFFIKNDSEPILKNGIEEKHLLILFKELK